MSQPLYRFIDGRAVVVDWAWLKSHTYKELVELLEKLNERKAKGEEVE